MKSDNSKTHLCDTCSKADTFPECLPQIESDVEFGDGRGMDNIVMCENYDEEVDK